MSSKKLWPKKRGANLNRLNAQQQMFVEAFFANRRMNAGEAAVVAGYKKTDGNRLLDNPAIRAIIEKRMQEIIWEHQASRERIVRELQCIAFMNPQDLFDDEGKIRPLKDMPQAVARTIRKMRVSYVEEIDPETGESVTIKSFDIDFHDKLTAIELLMRHLGMMDVIKHEVKQVVDWDQMVKPHANPEAKADKEDQIEARILEYRPLPT